MTLVPLTVTATSLMKCAGIFLPVFLSLRSPVFHRVLQQNLTVVVPPFSFARILILRAIVQSLPSSIPHVVVAGARVQPPQPPMVTFTSLLAR